MNPIELHKKLNVQENQTFWGGQILLKSQLCASKWGSLLKGYWDTQLPLLIRHDFPLDHDRKCILEAHSDNHKSAQDYPNDVQAYLDEEHKYDAILGPFSEPPIHNLHTSPFITRDKSNASHRRVIVDLSFHIAKSVTPGVTKDIYV